MSDEQRYKVIPEWGIAMKRSGQGETNPDDDGYKVPEVFKEYRSNFSQQPADIGDFRKMLMYRCGRYGTKEIEIILTDWFKDNGLALSYGELE